MKKVLLSLLVLGVAPCFGQQAPNPTVEELTALQQKVNSAFERHDSLSEVEKETLYTSCELATHLYGYLKAKEGITVPDSINVEALCKKVTGKKILAAIQVKAKDLKSKEDEFDNLLNKLKTSEKNKEFEEATQKITELKGEMAEECATLDKLLIGLKENGTVPESETNDLGITSCTAVKKLEKDVNKESKKFIIVGNNDPIEADSLFKQGIARKFFEEVIGTEGKSRLGTFEILPEEAPIALYLRTKGSKIEGLENASEKYVTVSSIFKDKAEIRLELKDSTTNVKEVFKSSHIAEAYSQMFPAKTQGSENQNTINNSNSFPQNVLFKSIAFETREGGMVDIRLQTLSADKKVELYFESEAPVSMLNFTRRAKRSFLVFSNKFNDKTEDESFDYRDLDPLYIRVSDVIKYVPDEGNNYVPEDIALRLPADLKAENTENTAREYELINDSSLSNLLDLRAYTDFLGLFADESNGLFQIEGKADFFLHPFNFNRSSLYLFKKVTPFVRYSRLEEENSYITTTPQDDTQQFDDSRLELLEKSNLEFGLDFNIASFRLLKESPVWFSVHVPINVYNTKVRIPAEEEDSNGMDPEAAPAEAAINFTTFGIGGSASIEIKRMSNFGLNLNYSIKNHSPLGNYSVDNIKEPDNFWVNSLDAEVFYYPGEDESRSIFLRMRGFRQGESNGAAFQQLQFGYRFTIGLNKVQAKD